MHISPAQRRFALAAVALIAAFAAGAIFVPHGSAGGAAHKTRKARLGPLTTVSCGQVISASITVDNDLFNCAGTGLTIAGKATVNLNGHVVDGVGGSTGVSVTSAGATIENGVIQQFSTGVSLTGMSDRALSLHVSNNGTGIEEGGGGDVVTGDFVASNSGAGIEITSGSGNQVTNNFSRANATGIQILTQNTTVSGNKALNNSADGILGGGAPGIVITGNVANGNSSDGIATGGQSTLSKNTAYFNSALGIAASPFDTDAGGNKAGSNVSQHQCLNVVCS